MKRILILLSLLCAMSAQALTNGDFESGNTGFTVSGYTYADTSVAGDRYDFRTESPWSGSYGSLTDHTSGGGQYMVVNGSAVAANYFWSQNVDVVAGEEYTFSGWAANLTLAPNPVIQLNVDNINKGSFSVGANSNPPVWEQFSFTWTAATTETVSLTLHDTQTAANGNDFAIDDLGMVPEPATASLMALVAGLGFLISRHLVS